jgi:hypothetical protein
MGYARVFVAADFEDTEEGAANPIDRKGSEEILFDDPCHRLVEEIVKMAIKSTDVCTECFEIPPHVLQIGVHVFRFHFHVVYEFFLSSVHHSFSTL